MFAPIRARLTRFLLKRSLGTILDIDNADLDTDRLVNIDIHPITLKEWKITGTIQQIIILDSWTGFQVERVKLQIEQVDSIDKDQIQTQDLAASIYQQQDLLAQSFHEDLSQEQANTTIDSIREAINTLIGSLNLVANDVNIQIIFKQVLGQPPLQCKVHLGSVDKTGINPIALADLAVHVSFVQEDSLSTSSDLLSVSVNELHCELQTPRSLEVGDVEIDLARVFEPPALMNSSGERSEPIQLAVSTKSIIARYSNQYQVKLQEISYGLETQRLRIRDIIGGSIQSELISLKVHTIESEAFAVMAEDHDCIILGAIHVNLASQTSTGEAFVPSTLNLPSAPFKVTCPLILHNKGETTITGVSYDRGTLLIAEVKHGKSAARILALKGNTLHVRQLDVSLPPSSVSSAESAPALQRKLEIPKLPIGIIIDKAVMDLFVLSDLKYKDGQIQGILQLPSVSIKVKGNREGDFNVKIMTDGRNAGFLSGKYQAGSLEITRGEISGHRDTLWTLVESVDIIMDRLTSPLRVQESGIRIDAHDANLVEDFIPSAKARAETEALEKWEDVANPPDGRVHTYGASDIIEDWFSQSGSLAKFPTSTSQNQVNIKHFVVRILQGLSTDAPPIDSSVELIAQDINIVVEQYPLIATVSQTIIAKFKLEIVDKVISSRWNKFLTESNIKVELSVLKNEHQRLHVNLGDLRFYIDQDALDVIVQFFAHKSPEPTDRMPTMIETAEFTETRITLDYKPKHVDYDQIRDGRLAELVNFFHLEEATLVLEALKLFSIEGWPQLGTDLLDAYLPYVTPSMASAWTPLKSLTNLSSASASLFLLPIGEYQRDGDVLRGVSKGTKKFAETAVLEGVKMGSRIARGSKSLLEFVASGEEEGKESGKSTPRQRRPSNITEGFQQAYGALTGGFSAARKSISSASGARGKVRAVPVAMLQPVIGVTGAVQKTLEGFGGSLDKKAQEERALKYRMDKTT